MTVFYKCILLSNISLELLFIRTSNLEVFKLNSILIKQNLVILDSLSTRESLVFPLEKSPILFITHILTISVLEM